METIASDGLVYSDVLEHAVYTLDTMVSDGRSMEEIEAFAEHEDAYLSYMDRRVRALTGIESYHEWMEKDIYDISDVGLAFLLGLKESRIEIVRAKAPKLLEHEDSVLLLRRLIQQEGKVASMVELEAKIAEIIYFYVGGNIDPDDDELYDPDWWAEEIGNYLSTFEYNP